MELRPKSIELLDFKEELLPSGRKLLHCLFKQKFGTSHYKWTPPWGGECGVERLFFKALEIEEWNDPEGAWSKELREVSKEIPSLEELKLPVKIQVGDMAELAEEREDGTKVSRYRVAIELLEDELPVSKEREGDKQLICIGEVKIPWEALGEVVLNASSQVRARSKGVQNVVEGDYWNVRDIGVRFSVWLDAGLGKTTYQIVGKEIVSQIRSFICKRLSDYRALKRGFEEL